MRRSTKPTPVFGDCGSVSCRNVVMPAVVGRGSTVKGTMMGTVCDDFGLTSLIRRAMGLKKEMMIMSRNRKAWSQMMLAISVPRKGITIRGAGGIPRRAKKEERRGVASSEAEWAMQRGRQYLTRRAHMRVVESPQAQSEPAVQGSPPSQVAASATIDCLLSGSIYSKNKQMKAVTLRLMDGWLITRREPLFTYLSSIPKHSRGCADFVFCFCFSLSCQKLPPSHVFDVVVIGLEVDVDVDSGNDLDTQ